MQKLDENKAVAVGDNLEKPFEQLNRLNSDSDPDASISGHAVGVSLHGDTVTYSPTLNNFLPKISVGMTLHSDLLTGSFHQSITDRVTCWGCPEMSARQSQALAPSSCHHFR